MVGLVSTGSAALMVVNGLGFIPTVVLSLGIGAVYGLFNGVVTTKMRIQAFIATLASMNIARGLARFWSNGIGIPLTYGIGPGLAAPEFEFLQARIGGVLPVPALVFLVLIVAFWVVLKYTASGASSKPSGGNARRRTLSGINVDRIKIIAFVLLCGMLSAGGGHAALRADQHRAAQQGIGYELNAEGRGGHRGTSLAGGRGRISARWWAPDPGLLDKMLGLKGVNSNLQLVVKGLLIIVAVFAQAERKKD